MFSYKSRERLIYIQIYCRSITLNFLVQGCYPRILLQHFIVLQLEINFMIINLEQKKQRMEKPATHTLLNYKFSQIFGYKGPNQKILEEDIVTTLKFDSEGKNIAVGDKAGRIIVFQAEQTKRNTKNYNYCTQFQSHINQFDPLRSMQIEEQIKGIEWLQPQGKYNKLVSTNERSIKVWKFFEKVHKKVTKNAGKQLFIPKLEEIDKGIVAEPQKIFPNKHLTPINSIVKSNNEQFLLSSDETQILLWSFQKVEKPYIVLNTESKKRSSQTSSMITCSKYHPNSDSLFIYATDKGLLQMVDLRISPNAQSSTVSFGPKNQPKNYLLELVSRISGVDFLRSGKYILSRDFLTVKLWDVCQPNKPVNTFMLNDGLKSKLCQMTENESIYDNFFVNSSPNGSHILTGSYNNWFHLINADDGSNAQYQLNYRKSTVVKEMSKGNQVGKVDYLRKIQVGDFHPKTNTLVVGSLNCFFTYSL